MLYLFIAGVTVFVALLVQTFRLGTAHKRTGHIRMALVTLLVVMPTLVYLVEKTARGRDGDVIAFRTHMGCVAITLFCGGLLATLGWQLRKKGSLRLGHRLAVYFFLFSLLPTVGTGSWLLTTLRDPIPIDKSPPGISLAGIVLFVPG